MEGIHSRFIRNNNNGNNNNGNNNNEKFNHVNKILYGTEIKYIQDISRYFVFEKLIQDKLYGNVWKVKDNNGKIYILKQERIKNRNNHEINNHEINKNRNSSRNNHGNKYKNRNKNRNKNNKYKNRNKNKNNRNKNNKHKNNKHDNNKHNNNNNEYGNSPYDCSLNDYSMIINEIRMFNIINETIGNNIIKCYNIYKMKHEDRVDIYIQLEYCEHGNIKYIGLNYLENIKKIESDLENIKNIESDYWNLFNWNLFNWNGKSNMINNITNEFYERVKIISRQVLKGLVYLKSKGIVHRDIKCDNIVMNSKGEVKIIDFGVSETYATIIENEFKSGNRIIIGTSRFIAPEIYKGEDYDYKVDIWSLGITLIELVTGKIAYGDEMDIMYMLRINNSKHLNYRKILKDNGIYNVELIDFILTCLTYDKEKRPNAIELLKHNFINND